MTDTRDELLCDTECYSNFWSIGFLRLRDGKLRIFEHSVRKPSTQEERDQIRAILLQNRIITYNGIPYDMPMIYSMLDELDNASLKRRNDALIVGGLKYWEAEREWNLVIPRSLDHIDLIEPQPNAFASLKTLNGRLHGRKLQDLPYTPDTHLSPEEMDHTLGYMGNDLDATGNVFTALKEPLELRRALGAEYGLNFMSKSDAQIGEAILKKRVEQITKERVEKVRTPAGTTFRYPVPDYLSFQNPQLREILERVRETEFMVLANGKVDLPKWMTSAPVTQPRINEDGQIDHPERPISGQITIGQTTYQMGIGGLHSTESNRALHSDNERTLKDFDVASYYPAIILNSGMYPKALGPTFLDVYRKIRDERVVAKRAAADKSLPEAEREAAKVKAEGLKIALNGCFGKLGSPYSILYAPHLMIAVTLTGQLALLMLIDRAEAAGIPVVSGNTDGVVFHCPDDMEDVLAEITAQWERDTGFELEETRYRSIYNRSVNDYIAVKEDGSIKWKGVISNPWRSGDGFKPDLRAQLMKNPQMTIISNAVVDLIRNGTPIEETIRAGRDVRDFVTVVKVDGGAIWNGRPVKKTRSIDGGYTQFEVNVGVDGGEYLGKVVRYIWSKNGAEILRAKAHPSTGTHGKVSKTDGCRPMMELPDAFPDDIDHDRYIAEAREVLMDIGYDHRPPPVKPIRLYKWSAAAWWAIAA